jgi:hypothetical protein
MTLRFTPNLLFLFLLLFGVPKAHAATLAIAPDATSIPMGHSVALTVTVTPDAGAPAADWLVLTFVNGRRWGAHQWTDAAGTTTFNLPLPNTGPQRIEAMAWSPNPNAASLPAFDRWQGVVEHALLVAGARMPDAGLRSQPVQVEVTWRAIPRKDNGGTLFGMQWEPWLTPHNAWWTTAQAVPVQGFYSSYDRDVTRQHLLWFADLGVDFLMADWSNHLWEKQHWHERGDATAEIIHATELALESMAVLRDEGIPVPKMVLMPGLSNGPPTTITALDEMLAWMNDHYLRNPRFEGLWQLYDGKPLVVILDTATLAAKPDAQPINQEHWTVRWMSTQLQITKHERFGYWSWMDGSLYPIVTMRDGKAEAITVTPAYFAETGWIYPPGRGRRNGSTYLESFRPAFEHRPRVVLLHQWNEYAGQPEGQGYGENKDRYVDSYSVELSDDIEPVSLSSPGYRSDPGGWGFLYTNLTQAILAMYRGEYPDDTLLAIEEPPGEERVPGGPITVRWTTLGRAPEKVQVLVDDQVVAEVQGVQEATLPVGMAAGPHIVEVRAVERTTHFRLALDRLETPLAEPVPSAARVVLSIPSS